MVKPIDLTNYPDKIMKKKKRLRSGAMISPDAPKIIRWMVKYSGGIIKGEKEAVYAILISLILIFFLISFWIGTIFKGPYIPNEALVNPELGLPISD